MSNLLLKNLMFLKGMIITVKNVMKKMFSLLLVGVVAISMFGFISSTRAEAAEAGSKGTVQIYQKGLYVARFDVNFFDGNNNEIDSSSKRLAIYQGYDIAIPDNAEYVQVDVYVYGWGHKKTLKFKANDQVSSKSVINITTDGSTWDTGVNVHSCNGWQKYE